MRKQSPTVATILELSGVSGNIAKATTNYVTFSATDFRCANTFRPQLTGFITCAEQPSRSGSCKPCERETQQTRLPNHWSGARSDRTRSACIGRPVLAGPSAATPTEIDAHEPEASTDTDTQRVRLLP